MLSTVGSWGMSWGQLQLGTRAQSSREEAVLGEHGQQRVQRSHHSMGSWGRFVGSRQLGTCRHRQMGLDHRGSCSLEHCRQLVLVAGSTAAGAGTGAEAGSFGRRVPGKRVHCIGCRLELGYSCTGVGCTAAGREMGWHCARQRCRRLGSWGTSKGQLQLGTWQLPER